MPRLRGRKFTGLSLIEQQHVLALRATAFRLGKANRFALLSLLMAGHLAGEHTALDGGTDGDHLVGVDALAGHLAEVPKTANAAESNQIK